MGLRQGEWYVSSKLDPRWNSTGESLVGMFMTLESCSPAKQAVEEKTKLYGDPPEDLVFGYCKF